MQKVEGEPEKEVAKPKPALPPRASHGDARALYAELLQHPSRTSINDRLEGLTFPQVEALMKVIQTSGYLDQQPVQAFWAWKELQRYW